MGVRISFHEDGTGKCTAITAFLDGDIDHHTAKDMREKIDEHVHKKSPNLLKLDFSGVHFMDSSGIGLIMGRYKLVSSMSGRLRVVNIPVRLERMVKLSGLEALGIFNEEVDVR